jgi:hypothetical protein
MSLKRITCSLGALVLLLPFLGTASPTPTGLTWSTFLGGCGSDEGYDIAVDGAGDVYVTGLTWSRDFPATFGAYRITHRDSSDAFVLKLDPGGGLIVYATFLGGSSWDEAYGIAVDHEGSAYVGGRTASVDFPITDGAFDGTHNGGRDAFVAKVSPTGSVLAYCTFLGGNDHDKAYGIAVDGSGHAYLTGWTRSADFPTTAGAFSTAHAGRREEDAFVVKLDPEGGRLVYATFLGGSGEDWGRDIAVNDAGAAYVAILTYSRDFPATQGAFDATHNGGREALVAKVDPSGSGLVYATFLGGSGQDWSQGIAVDGDGCAWVAGVTFSPDFPTTPGSFDTDHNGLSDAFVARFNTEGSDLIYASYLGATGEERSTDIALDGSGNVYLAGWTRSADFPVTDGALGTSFGGHTDVFVARLDPTGSRPPYSSLLGGSEFEAIYGIALDGPGNVYAVGWTRSADFPVTDGAFDTQHRGESDVFVVKLNLGAPKPRGGRR